MSDSACSIESCEEHSVDTSFLWLFRDQAVFSPNYDAEDIAEIDQRIDTHLKQLLLAGETGWRAAVENLGWHESGEVFTGSAVAFSIGKDEFVQKALSVGAESVALTRGVISALAWFNGEIAKPYIHKFIRSQDPIIQRIGIGASGVLRKDVGEDLNTLLACGNPLVSSRAVKAAGELGRVDAVNSCLSLLHHDDHSTQFWAAWSSVLLGRPEAAIEKLKEIAVRGGNHAELACDLAGRSMNLIQAQEWLQALGQSAENYRLAVVFARAIAKPVLVPWLINMMTVPEVARKAGEAFTDITGADLVDDELAGDVPLGFESSPTENPCDEYVQIDPDEDLPWPNVDLVSKWWAENQKRFAPHERYMLGYSLSDESLHRVLNGGKQTNRHAAALELKLKAPDQPLYEIRAHHGQENGQ